MTEAELKSLEEKVASLLDMRVKMYEGFENDVETDSRYSPVYHAARLWLQDRRAARGGDADA